MSAPPVLEELTTLIQVLAEDAGLHAWFSAMEKVSAPQRAAEFQRMAEQMRAAGEDAELVHATALLADARVFDAVRLTVRDTIANQR